MTLSLPPVAPACFPPWLSDYRTKLIGWHAWHGTPHSGIPSSWSVCMCHGIMKAKCRLDPLWVSHEFWWKGKSQGLLMGLPIYMSHIESMKWRYPLALRPLYIPCRLWQFKMVSCLMRLIFIFTSLGPMPCGDLKETIPGPISDRIAPQGYFQNENNRRTWSSNFV